MDDPELKPRRLLAVAALTLATLLAATAIALGLLHLWKLPAGGEAGSAALIAPIPAPRLQTAPQLDRADGLTAAPPVEQQLGAELPRQLGMVDADGAGIDWNVMARDGRPLVLLPAYYRCDTLCGTVAHGALEALADTGLAPSAWRLVLFSIDPSDTPTEARTLQRVYAQYAMWSRPKVYGGARPELHLLTGRAEASHALAQAIGFRWLAETGSDAKAAPQFAHATGLVVLTPDGTVSRYLLGVRFDSTELRAALVEASAGKVGSLSERLLLACSHLDPLRGAHDGAVMVLVRIVALAVPAMLGVWIWRVRASR